MPNSSLYTGSITSTATSVTWTSSSGGDRYKLFYYTYCPRCRFIVIEGNECSVCLRRRVETLEDSETFAIERMIFFEQAFKAAQAEKRRLRAELKSLREQHATR